MQTLNLTPSQLKHLKQHGIVWVWMPINGKTHLIESDDVETTVNQDALIIWKKNQDVVLDIIAKPYRLGERVEFTVHKTGWKNDDNGITCSPTVVFDTEYATLTTSPEPVRLGDVTPKQWESMGVVDEGYGFAIEAAKLKLEEIIYPGITPGSWGWVFTVKKEG